MNAPLLPLRSRFGRYRRVLVLALTFVLVAFGCGLGLERDFSAGSAATPWATTARRPTTCAPSVNVDGRPGLAWPVMVVCNDTTEGLHVQRVDGGGGPLVTIPSGRHAVMRNERSAGTIDWSETRRTGASVAFAVTGMDGTPRGRIVLGSAYVTGANKDNWVCLSMAAEPPYVINANDDIPERCPGLTPGTAPSSVDPVR